MSDDVKLLTALLNKVDSILTGGDDVARPSPDSFLSWCLPGLPFQAADLQFAVKGITGKDGDETRTLVRTAAEFSRAVNYVPTVKNNTDEKHRHIYDQMGKSLWTVYDDVLKLSEVASSALTEEQKQKIKKFRSLMTVTKTVKDIVTDEKKQLVEDGPMIKAYKGKKAAYDEASLAYNSKRLAALNGDDKASVQDFTLNADTYRGKVRAAMDDWTTNGYKDDVEKINAFIHQISQKDLTLLKADLQDAFKIGKMTDPTSGGEFYLTSFYPGNFVNDDKGWTKFTFFAANTDSYSKQTHSSTSGGGGFNFGLWRVGGSGGSTKDTSLGSLDASDFYMEFSITQVSLSRPWFSPEFLLNTAWRFKEKLGQDALSDGNVPAKGQLTSYPTTAIFIKDVKIKSSSVHNFAETISSSLTAGASVGWGPFRISGSHSDSSTATTTRNNIVGDTLTIEGMQLLAFKSFPMPKSPNPSPDITRWV